MQARRAFVRIRIDHWTDLVNLRDLVKRAGRMAAWRWNRGCSAMPVSPMVSALSFSDEEFLAQFALPEVTGLLDRGHVEEAKTALLSHYAHRSAPPWPPFPRRMTRVYDSTDAELAEEADAILGHRFGEDRIYLGEKIDWRCNPTPDPRARWTRELHRHRWWAVLAVAYTRTRDERYAAKFVQLMEDWVRSNPPPALKNERDPVWSLMQVGMRCLVWPAAFRAFYPSPAFTEQAKLTMLRSIYDHAQFLSLFKTRLNHLLREANGLAYVSSYFPEFKRAGEWLQVALRRLDEELAEQVNEDGSSIERSTGYQWLVAEEFEGSLELCEERQLRLPKSDLRLWVTRLYRVLMHTSRPDGTWPQLSDGFMEESGVLRQRLAVAAEKLGRGDFAYVATQGASGIAPAETSTEFKDGGFYVMRSDWSRHARYLLFNAGPFGGPHGHEDKLSIEVYAYGTPFIVDPGTYTYNVNDPYRNYFVSSLAHNTAVVAGKSQVRRWSAANMQPPRGAVEQIQWIAQESFDYVEGRYTDGYGDYSFKPPRRPQVIGNVVHTRRVLFVKPDYWLLVDELESSTPRDFEVLFHAPPAIGIEELPQEGVRLRSSEKDACLYLLPVATAKIKLRTASGCEDPIQGWYSDGRMGHKVPAPVILYRVEDVSSVLFATLLYPCAAEQEARGLDLQEWNVAGSTAIGYKVTTPQGSDYIMLARNGESKRTAQCGSAALVTLRRTDLQGTLVSSSRWAPEPDGAACGASSEACGRGESEARHV
jgi:hypothetical protein